MSKEADLDHPVHDLVAQRWSPYALSDQAIEPEVIRSLFEAARWAPSSYNEQPWRYIVATKADPERHAKVLGCLVEANQAWAKNAYVLALGVVSERFSKNGKPNKAAEHDLGLASANLSLEATARGLYVHQMIGIDPEKARETFGIPEGFHALTGLAIAHKADPSTLPEALRPRDTNPRSRNALDAFVFGATWGEAGL